MTTEEVETIEQLARSRTAPVRTVERARIIQLAREGRRGPAIAQELGICPGMVRLWLKRFNDRGIEGLKDQPRGPLPRHRPGFLAPRTGTAGGARQPGTTPTRHRIGRLTQPTATG